MLTEGPSNFRGHVT